MLSLAASSKSGCVAALGISRSNHCSGSASALRCLRREKRRQRKLGIDYQLAAPCVGFAHELEEAGNDGLTALVGLNGPHLGGADGEESRHGGLPVYELPQS